MAHLWIQAPDWSVVPLDASPFPLAALPEGEGPRPDAVLLRRDGSRNEWLLLARPTAGIAVNGLPWRAGLRQLLDQDEIRVPGLDSLYFSTERLARTEALPPLDHEVACPRCRQPIPPGAPAVRCPGCEVWHHASTELPCWSYAATCAYCDYATAQDTGFRWTPEGL